MGRRSRRSRAFPALAAAGLLGLGVGVLPAAAEASVNGREARQRARIHAGLEDGSLTRREAHVLAHQQVHLERRERRARRSGGGLGPRERHALHHGLDRSARSIHRLRHNDRVAD